MLKDYFFGRSLYLDILTKRIDSLKEGYRQNIAMIGDESVGKTSIIFKCLNDFFDNRLIITYLETRQETLDSFCHRFIAVLLYNFLLNSNEPLKEDLDFLIMKAGPYIPLTIEKIKIILAELNKRKKENIFTALLSLCETIHLETQKFCVVCFDEFHNLENLGIKNLYSEWSKVLITQKNTMYVIVSSHKSKTQNILSKDLNLLFGNFEVINVEPFDINASEEFLRVCLPAMNLSKGAMNFIVHFTGGFPFYIAVIAEALNHSKDEASLTDILENLLYANSGILNQKFSNYLKRFLDNRYAHDYISILHLISSGQNKLKDISHVLHKPIKEINSRLEWLMQLDAVSRSGDFFKINDRVFGFWLKFVYQERLKSLTFDAKNQKAGFRKNIEAMIQEFLIDTNKSISERVTELLKLFDDETILLEKKRFKLNHFREIKPLVFNQRALKDGLICRSSNSLWIMGFKYDSLTEEDIQEFSRECKKYRHKMQRKVIVALKDLDPNSRLRALEEKVLTLDLNHLNQILDLYSRPRIIA